MKDLMITNNELTMSSYDLLNEVINPARMSAGESEVRNNVFIARIEDEIDDLEAYKIFVSYGKEVKYYILNIEQMMLIGMRESKAVRRKVLETLKKLSEENSFSKLPNFNDPVEAARAWADQYEAKEIAQQALIEAKPKIDYFERVSINTAHLNATQVGKKVGMSATALNKHLDDLDVYNKSVKRSRVFKQWFIDEGFGEVKTTDNGYTQSVFTIKGEQKVIELLTSEGII